MTTRAWIALGLLIYAGCEREAHTRRTTSGPVSSAAAGHERAKPSPSIEQSTGDGRPQSARTIAEHRPTSDPKIEETMAGNFRGKNRPSRVLFLGDGAIVHAWDENGTERREPITTEPPPGHRECKALRSRASQDFLLCMYWFTGPGGGRVDGVVFDVQRRMRGEFFSGAINVQLLSTLCHPETMVGPMPSFNVDGWSVTAATDQRDAEVQVRVGRKGWSTKDAEALRARPETKKFCQCAGSDHCPGAPTPPSSELTVAYRLTNDRLQPTEESRKALDEISAQWGHSAFLESWNMKMRGF
jgi:hypothetical protein